MQILKIVKEKEKNEKQTYLSIYYTIKAGKGRIVSLH